MHVSDSAHCPDCDRQPAVDPNQIDRRGFLRTVGATTLTTLLPAAARIAHAETPATAPASGAKLAASASETSVKALYDSLSEQQRNTICFAWDHMHPKHGLLRTHVSNNWQISSPAVRSEFFTREQQGIVFDIFRGLFQPEWSRKIVQQLKDDARGLERDFGAEQSIAIFGKPGEPKCEFVMTGRHLTIRADGNSESHVAFGGPIFHGHAATGDDEQVGHPGNIFWPQAVAANRVYAMLDGKQQKEALVLADLPPEDRVAFRDQAGRPGIPVRELARDQQEEMEKVLAVMLEPYRDADRAEVMACLKKEGGLKACNLAFYKDGDLGSDGVWDNWRLEGPAFVWYFRGYPHVHLWINVADDPSVKLNASA